MVVHNFFMAVRLPSNTETSKFVSAKHGLEVIRAEQILIDMAMLRK